VLHRLRSRRSPTAPPVAGEPGLSACDVSYRIGPATLVDDVSIDVRAGELLTIVGPNGAGKSTLLKLLTGDLRPTAGRVLLDGRPLAAFSARHLALRRAVLPQQTALQFAFTAEEVVLMGRSPHSHGGRGDSAADHAIARAALARTDALELAPRVFQSLSGGEQQRVTLARVLAQQPSILLLDEPTNALDIRHQELVMAIAREEAAAGAAVLAILHDLNLAAAHADRIAVMHHGRIVARGTPAEVLTEALLSDVFEHPLRVAAHPLAVGPLILPQRGR
jgi:iron complex transport system ATP-binding protein